MEKEHLSREFWMMDTNLMVTYMEMDKFIENYEKKDIYDVETYNNVKRWSNSIKNSFARAGKIRSTIER